MSHLAIFYTNNHIKSELLNLSLDSFVNNISSSMLTMPTTGVVVSDKHIHYSKNIPNLYFLKSKKETTGKGHLSIISNICQALNHMKSESVSLHEHDVLYPEQYLYCIQSIHQEYSQSFDYLAYSRLIGVNHTGYQNRKSKDIPLSILSFNRPVIEELMKQKESEYYVNNGFCYLEPGYAGSYGRSLRGIQLDDLELQPAIHVNMDKTLNNHHFTNHYAGYEDVSTSGFSEWPGDLSYLFGKANI